MQLADKLSAMLQPQPIRPRSPYLIEGIDKGLAILSDYIDNLPPSPSRPSRSSPKLRSTVTAPLTRCLSHDDHRTSLEVPVPPYIMVSLAPTFFIPGLTTTLISLAITAHLSFSSIDAWQRRKGFLRALEEVGIQPSLVVRQPDTESMEEKEHENIVGTARERKERGAGI